MTIVTDYDIGDRVVINNRETGVITSIKVTVRDNKTGGDYRIEYEIDHAYIRYANQLNKA